MTPAQILRVDAPHHAATVTLVAQDGSRNNSFNFDGYSRGELLLNVPRGWKVTIHCRNGGGRRVSCAVVKGSQGTTPAFRGASTPDPVDGLGPGESATFTFIPTRVGSFRIVSLVPGDAGARMYDVLEVTRGGRPSASARPGP